MSGGWSAFSTSFYQQDKLSEGKSQKKSSKVSRANALVIAIPSEYYPGYKMDYYQQCQDERQGKRFLMECMHRGTSDECASQNMADEEFEQTCPITGKKFYAVEVLGLRTTRGCQKMNVPFDKTHHPLPRWAIRRCCDCMFVRIEQRSTSQDAPLQAACFRQKTIVI